MLLSPCCCSASCWYEGTLYVWSTACRLACRSCSHEISLSQKALKDVTDIIFNGTQDVMMPTRAPQTVPVNCSRCDASAAPTSQLVGIGILSHTGTAHRKESDGIFQVALCNTSGGHVPPLLLLLTPPPAVASTKSKHAPEMPTTRRFLLAFCMSKHHSVALPQLDSAAGAVSLAVVLDPAVRRACPEIRFCTITLFALPSDSYSSAETLQSPVVSPLLSPSCFR